MTIDQKLIKQCIKGKEKAQYALYKQCFQGLMSICSRYQTNHDDAVALLNQGFLKILTNLKQYQPEKPFMPWAKRVMINVAIDEFRKHKAYHAHMQPTDFLEPDAPEYALDWNEIDQYISAEELDHMLRQLPPVTKQVFNLYAIDGFKHKEISDILHISEGTSKWHLSEARQKLQAMLKQIIHATRSLAI